MLGALAALALLPHLAVQNPFHAFKPGQPPQVRTETAILPGGWKLAQTHDAFTGVSSCRLSHRRVAYAAGVATFSFGSEVDTANALFRVDGGPVISAGEVGPEVAGQGVSLLSGNTWNPSDGRVRIPWTKLSGARRVDIRPNANRYARPFPLDGLDAALAAARTRGCSDLA